MSHEIEVIPEQKAKVLRDAARRHVRPITLTDFLLARIAEDEAAAHQLGDLFARIGADYPARVLADLGAKRRILADYRALDADYRATRAPESEARRFQALVSIGQLATVYADHPDYREDWRP